MNRIVLALGILVGGIHIQCSADMVGSHFTGEVVDDGAPYGQAVELWSTVSGTIVYDSATVGTSCGSSGSNCSMYRQERSSGLQISFGDVIVRTDDYIIKVLNNTMLGVPPGTPPKPPVDVFTIQWAINAFPGFGIEHPLMINGIPQSSGWLTLNFLDHSAELFSDTSLPAAISFSDFSALDTNILIDTDRGIPDIIFSVYSLENFELLTGDFNYDSNIDMTDYELWQNSFASSTNHAGDANNDSVVDAADYTIWRDHGSLGLGSGGISAAEVPEPATGLLVLTPLLTLALRRSVRRQSFRRRG